MDNTQIERLRRERERNLEFCVCVFDEGGDVESPCLAHVRWAEDREAALRRERDVLRDRVNDVAAGVVPGIMAQPDSWARTTLVLANKAREGEEWWILLDVVEALRTENAGLRRERDVLRGALTAIADADPPYSISSKGARAILEDADKAREG